MAAKSTEIIRMVIQLLKTQITTKLDTCLKEEHLDGVVIIQLNKLSKIYHITEILWQEIMFLSCQD